VQQETLAGQQAGVRGTPTLFVNGQMLPNVPSYDQLVSLINTLKTAVPTPPAAAG
jgi:protein-disulfide isomerase